jgi:hypothetical protein
VETKVATATSLPEAVEREGFAFVRSATMRDMIAPFGSLDDWSRFADSWNSLELDRYMADGGRYRRRRHAVFGAAADGPIHRKPHQPHVQAPEYNPLHGGVERWFEPIAPEIAEGATMRTILAFCRSFFAGLAASPGARARQPRPAEECVWHVEVHQFRVEARAGEHGRPTPEGLHRDGVDYVLVLLVNRRNIASGVTAIHALDGMRLGHFTLTDPLDAALVDDRRVAHGVTPVESMDPSAPAHRDVLVVTFAGERRSSRLSAISHPPSAQEPA